MRCTKIELHNWRNFLTVEAPLSPRTFLVGANGSGKSNFLDAFRFLRDIADPRGGLQQATARRGGLDRLRSCHAPATAELALLVEALQAEDGTETEESWSYILELGDDGEDRPVVRREAVRRGRDLLLERPDLEDRSDPSRLTQTHLEQVSTNRAFRALQRGFAQIRYLHLVPQLLRDRGTSPRREADPYGSDFLQQIARLPREIAETRLRRTIAALRHAVPQLAELELSRDEDGTPHLRSRCRHWRRQAWQTEDELSDGTLRLFGLLWALSEGGPLLLEEPELSLHAAVVRYLPLLLAAVGGGQTLVSTHSAELLTDEGIAAEEVLLFVPGARDTRVSAASADRQIRALIAGGLSVGDAVVPSTAPADAGRFLRFVP